VVEETDDVVGEHCGMREVIAEAAVKAVHGRRQPVTARVLGGG
jgi:hypothetical protein